MILDRLDRAAAYERLHPLFAAGFAFLRRPDIATMAEGRHMLDGERAYAIVQENDTKPLSEGFLEVHRRYIDIQYVVEHTELIGWLPTSRCERIATPYAVDKDIGFFYERPQTWLEVPAGYFAIFFPADAHAPLATTGPVVKAVAKVAVDW